VQFARLLIVIGEMVAFLELYKHLKGAQAARNTLPFAALGIFSMAMRAMLTHNR
jgi:hypothetical protein